MIRTMCREASKRRSRRDFERLNVDLIYAIPGQTWIRGQVARSGDRAGTSHISCYGLTYEPNTPMAVRKRLGQLQRGRGTLELEMMRHARRGWRNAGMPAYEISNYAAAGRGMPAQPALLDRRELHRPGPSRRVARRRGRACKNRPHLGEWEQASTAGELPAVDVENSHAAQRAGNWRCLVLRLRAG